MIETGQEQTIDVRRACRQKGSRAEAVRGGWVSVGIEGCGPRVFQAGDSKKKINT